MEDKELQLDLFGLGFSPIWVLNVLEEEFNYEKYDFDSNGWEIDFWIYLERKDNKTYLSNCEYLCLYGTLMTFELYLRLEEPEELEEFIF